VIDPGVERSLLVVARFDVERWREFEIGVGPRAVFESVSEALLQRCLLVSVRPLAGPLEQGSISICSGSVLVDAVVPLPIGNIVGSITEQERSVVEFDLY
jgi:hypothetical protein